VSGVSGMAGRAPGPAGWSDAAEPPAVSHAASLTVVPERDGRWREIISDLLQPGHGGPADPAGAAIGRARGPSAGLVIDREQRRVLLDGREIELVFQEFELLEFLTAHPNRAFTREQIIAGAWVGGRQTTGRTVDVHICRLRRKLGPDWARYLVTVWRVGYTFRPPRLAVTP